MNIIQVYQTNPFDDGQGGGVRYVSNLLNGIKNECNEILFLGIGEKKYKDNIRLEPITKHMTGYIKFLLLLLLKLPFIDLSKYSVVHVHRLYFAIPFILLKPNLKIVCSLHGRTFSVFESKHGSLKLKLMKPIFQAIEKFCINKIDYLVPVSQDVIDSFEHKYNDFSSRKNISIIGSMLNLKNFFIQNSNLLQNDFGLNYKYILFIGRLADVKDVSFLINLWSSKFQNFSNLKLIIAGAGENENEYKNISNKKCGNNPPIFLGEIESKNIPKLISSSNMTILCSKHEASPTVVKESLSLGIPIITNKIGDVEEFIIDGQNGFIVNKDFDSYFNAIQKLINIPLSKEEVLNNSREKLKNCSLEYITNKYLEIYNKVIRK